MLDAQSGEIILIYKGVRYTYMPETVGQHFAYWRSEEGVVAPDNIAAILTETAEANRDR